MGKDERGLSLSLTHAAVAETHVMESHVMLTDVVRAVPVELENVLVLSDAVVEPTDLKRDILGRKPTNQTRRAWGAQGGVYS